MVGHRAVSSSAIVGVVLLALVGCVSTPPTLDDVAGLVTAADGPPGLEFSASGARGTAADDARVMEEQWEHSAGSPMECFPAFSTALVTDGAETTGGAADPSMEVASFTETADESRGRIIVSARIFADTAAAVLFLSAVEQFASDCVDGYSLKDDEGETVWRVEGIRTARSGEAHEGVTTVMSEELLADTDAAQRTTFLQRGAVVVAVYSETYPGETFELNDVDGLVSEVASRLANL